MTLIREQDIIDSVFAALQFIANYHPKDFIDAMYAAYQREASPAAKDAIAQILINSRMCAENQRPICQDTGIVNVFVKIGMRVTWDTDRDLTEIINDGVRRAYQHPDNVLRASIVKDPIGKRKNTGDNTPAVVHVELVAGDQVSIDIAAKGGGSENKAVFTILNPSDDLVDWVLKTVPKMGAGWCPPGMLGIGIGGTAEKAMLMAKQSLMEEINIQDLITHGPVTAIEKLRVELYEKVNQLGIGAQGLGGMTTVLDVKINDYPTHAASLPVAMIPNCAATRHVHFHLDGNGPAEFIPPSLSDWPDITWEAAENTRHVNLDTLTAEDMHQWQPGDTLLLSGHLLTGRDAAHKKIADLIANGQPLPAGLDFKDRFIYYVGPVDPVKGEIVGPAGPTTATRMDKFTETMLAKTGLLGMIGKAERGEKTVDLIKKYQSVYLIAVGGAAYLVSKAIKSSRLVAFEELGMEAVREFYVENMPVTVAVDSLGQSVHETGPVQWQQRIAGIPVKTVMQ
ncbi:Fumarate hydratase class I, aerobic [Methylophaga frappieri]|uniref:Fumarate hydratase class I n=1 Tax=Methylophaga frappieri (strain ATCC BAA-2434 / DSM 25690 / JAM7) TaxID=754477 RepID=I1YKZ3_METFJ|nr:fumarate hydratase [Methylophaga frappieri]AFJ03586.1 Fumarate hydratase class I, aerobic [Methylophaga frappieri]